MADKTRRKVLVCGASKGIGRAAALTFAQKGYEVTALARDQKALDSLQKEMGSHHSVHSVDFGNASQFLKGFTADFDVVVLNSGGPSSGPLTDAKVEEFQKAFEQHLYFNHQLLQKVLPHMKKQKFGRVITILSTSVKAPLPNLGVSNVLRAAMAAWVKTLAGELGPFGITVNNVLPGYTETDRLDELMQRTAKNGGVSADKIREQWLANIPARRFADPRETAAAIAFLASDDASYINGTNLPVDGGRLPTL